MDNKFSINDEYNIMRDHDHQETVENLKARLKQEKRKKKLKEAKEWVNYKGIEFKITTEEA